MQDFFVSFMIVGDVLQTKTIWQNHIKNASVCSDLHFYADFFLPPYFKLS